jgi:hypothetical protein
LSFWQIIRFQEKYKDFLFITSQNKIIDINEQFFSSHGTNNEFYYWREKKYSIDIKNKILNIIGALTNQNNEQKQQNITNENLFFINTVCGQYIKNHSFAIYNPKKISSITKNGYSIIIPILFNDEVILIKYKWNESIDIAQNEIKELDNFNTQSIIPNFLPKKQNTEIETQLCFSGILIPTKKYTSGKLINFFVKNDIQNKIWNNLNNDDLTEYLPNYPISQYFLDSTITDLDTFIRNYKHHIFYALMWLITGLYIIYYIYSLDKNKK